MTSEFSALITPLMIAPMINWTNNHFRVFMRLLAPRALVYTEMQTYGAIINNPARALHFSACESPIALQLGGANKRELVECARRAEDYGFAEINLNLGCPSRKVQAGKFGACLMLQPELVADCIAALKNSVKIPITAKTRIGVDHHDSYEFFSSFVHKLVAAGCDKLIVHARKAWLHGLSPKENRTIPPVNYNFVYNIKRELPNLCVVINGNIRDTLSIEKHRQKVDGVMIGRLTYQNPYAITAIHQQFYPESIVPTRQAILTQYIEYIRQQKANNLNLSLLLKPIFNINHGLPNKKYWQTVLQKTLQEKQLKYLMVAASMSQ